LNIDFYLRHGQVENTGAVEYHLEMEPGDAEKAKRKFLIAERE
jgi:hypothetical protein